MSKYALQGIRVLDFTWLLAGPYATRILSDFGAEVIKVQSKKTSTGTEMNTSGYFTMWNRNKLGITLDMSRTEGRDLALKLAAISDVIIENFTPRVMENWGLTYEAFKQQKQDIIMVSMSGMGHDGPWRNFAALGPTIQALSGITYLSAFDVNTPLGVGYAYADTVAGMYASLATLAALEHRDTTGHGQYIDISEFEAMWTLIGPALLDTTINNQNPLPQGNKPQGKIAAPYGCYRCRGNDRWCVIAVFDEEEWLSLCRVMGNPDWSNDERFATLLSRQKNAAELDTLIQRWTIQYTPEKVASLLQEAGVPASVVQNAADLVNDPQLTTMGFFNQTVHSRLGITKFDTTPIRLSETPADSWNPAPLLGEHNRYVFQDLLGMDEQQFIDYRQKGIIA